MFSVSLFLLLMAMKEKHVKQVEVLLINNKLLLVLHLKYGVKRRKPRNDE